MVRLGLIWWEGWEEMAKQLGAGWIGETTVQRAGACESLSPLKSTPLQDQKGRQDFWVSAPSKAILILVSFNCWAPWVCKLHVLLAKNLAGSGCTLLWLHNTCADLALWVMNSRAEVLWDGSKLVPSQFLKYCEKWNENICFHIWEGANIIIHQTYRGHQKLPLIPLSKGSEHNNAMTLQAWITYDFLIFKS